MRRGGRSGGGVQRGPPGPAARPARPSGRERRRRGVPSSPSKGDRARRAARGGAPRALMRLFSASGRRQQALAQYHQLREALRRDLEAEPDPQTGRLYRALLRGEAESDPPEPELRRRTARAPRRRPAEPARHNLPIALTSFIGRDRELREVARLLDRNRLLTLTGAGGSGKTRLGLEAATARASACHDGVWLVELAGLGDPALVPAATASALGLTLPCERPGPRRPQRSVGPVAHAADPRQLRASDLACAVLAEHLLGACPGLHILATSREPLRVPGEVTWRVPSLTLPPPSVRERLSSFPLSCGGLSAPPTERARGVDAPASRWTRRTRRFGDLLRLDGCRSPPERGRAAFSPAQLAERLVDCLAVLTAGSRSASTVSRCAGTLSWSHDFAGLRERADAVPPPRGSSPARSHSRARRLSPRARTFLGARDRRPHLAARRQIARRG